MSRATRILTKGKHKRLLPAKISGKTSKATLQRIRKDGEELTKLTFTRAPDGKIKKIAKDYGIKVDDSVIGWRGGVYDQLYSELGPDELMKVAKAYKIG